LLLALPIQLGTFVKMQRSQLLDTFCLQLAPPQLLPLLLLTAPAVTMCRHGHGGAEKQRS
jgi:hypothetical protein